MRRLTTLCWIIAGLSLGAGPAVAAPMPHAAGDYVYEGSFEAGAPGAWDYASFDAAHGRLYIGHRDSIAVIDAAARKVVGQVGPLDEAHGAGIDAAHGHGFATSGGDGTLKEFDLADLHIIRSIPVGDDADGVTFDPGTGVVILTLGDGKKLVLVDAATATITHQVDLPGEPEFVAADGHGKAFVNIASTGQLARVDIASGKLEAVWTLEGCKSPHGLAYDHRTHRLFSGCANAVVLAVDPASGKILATLPAGPRNDAIIVDERRGRVFCPNGDGTLTVIGEGPHDAFTVLRTIPTFLGVRSGAIDPATGVLYLTYGNVQITTGPRDPGGIRFGWDAAKVAVFAPND
jgi:DNA-binding beta-propeller fold protein YncE